ncbi:MAG: hypothetical protein M1840_004495 [Geoglossum simile]|nr:MAG: hypothetical protein M1840_004495 [Geoglossum simile]
MGLFKEAREAYRERKAEIHATRAAEVDEKRARRVLARARLEDSRSVASSRRSKSRRDGHHRHGHEHRDSGGRHRGGDLSRRHTDSPNASPTTPNSWGQNPDYYGELDRPLQPTRHHTSPDMDLAYGDSPPRSPVPTDEEAELASLLTKVNFILDEAHCLQHSATKTISTLQKNPDALAAVGLALAEISNLVIKMAPGALAAVKGSFPAIFAILASPQFMIAAGVGVGITVVAIGGFKIIKKMQGRGALPAPDAGMGQLEEINISGIDRWRRGIAEAEAESIGTSVDGEFITPEANAIRHAVEAQEDRRAGMRDRGRRRSSMDGETMTMMSSPSERGGRREKKDRKEKKEKKDKKNKKEKPDKMSKVVALFKHGNSVIV